MLNQLLPLHTVDMAGQPQAQCPDHSGYMSEKKNTLAAIFCDEAAAED